MQSQDIKYATFLPEEESLRAKPLPTMLQEAVMDSPVEASAAIMIGDTVSDMRAAAAVPCRRILVLTGKVLVDGAVSS